MFSAFWDAKTARVLFTSLMFAFALAFLYGARETLTLFLFAILFAYFVEPLVGSLSRPLRGRTRAIFATSLILVGLAVGLSFLVGPRIAHESKTLMTSLPGLLDRIASGQFLMQMGQTHGWTRTRELQIQQFFMSYRTTILAYGEGFIARLQAPLTHLWWLILIPILGVIFLKDADEMARGVVSLGSTVTQKNLLLGIIADVNVMLGSYIRAQMILSALTGIVLTVVLAIMRVPFAFLFGPLAGVCEYVPVVGPAIACALIFGVAFLAGYTHLLVLFFFLGTWRTIQDYVNAPRIMGRSLEISPIVEIFAVLAGGEIGGVVGALVSVPLLAILRILWVRLSSTDSISTPALAHQ